MSLSNLIPFIWWRSSGRERLWWLPSPRRPRYKTIPVKTLITRHVCKYNTKSVFILIYNNMWKEQWAWTNFIKDSISKWNHFFIELSSWSDINYGARTVPIPPIRFLWYPFRCYSKVFYSAITWDIRPGILMSISPLFNARTKLIQVICVGPGERCVYLL